MTEDLQSFPGQTINPDTILWVLSWDEMSPYGAVAGGIVAINDDCGGLNSCVVFSPQQSFWGLIVVAGYTYSGGNPSYGYCDVVIKKNGIESGRAEDVWFGGWSLASHTIRQDDELFVGVPAGASADWHENHLFVLSNSSLNCSSNCGSFGWCGGYAGCRIAGLARLHVPEYLQAARVLVGAYLQGTTVRTQLFHNRIGDGWIGSQYEDADSDWLTYEIEEWLGTCDTATGPGEDCSTTEGKELALRGGFHPSDSDNDGIEDSREVFGVRRICFGSMEEPYNDPGDCMDATFAWGDISGVPMFELPVSAMDSPDPTEYDLYLEVDAQENSGEELFLTAVQKLWVYFAYALEGLQCVENTSLNPGDCPSSQELEHYNRIVPHIYHDEVLVGRPQGRPGWSWWSNTAVFNRHFTKARKYTGTFRHALMVYSSAGITTSSPSRRFVAGRADEGSRYSTVFAHELGHAMGIPGDNYDVAYPSMMDYGWVHTGEQLNRKADSLGRAWSESVRDACDIDDDCLNGWECRNHSCRETCVDDSDCDDPAECDNGLCAISCAYENNRFSRGLESDLNESSLAERGYGGRTAAQVACYGDRNSQSFSVACNYSQTDCKIDWERDGIYDFGTVSADIDAGPTTLHDDNNDWLEMYGDGEVSLEDMFVRDMLVFGTTMLRDGYGNPLDYSGCDIETDALGGVQFGPGPEPTWLYGDGARFSGPGFAHEVRLGASPCFDSISTTIDSKHFEGFRFDFFTYLESDPLQKSVSYYYMVDSDLVEIRVFGGSRRVQAVVHRGGSTSTITSGVGLDLNWWYHIVVVWDTEDEIARLYVIPWLDNNNWDHDGADCKCAWNAPLVSEFSPGEISIGKKRSSSTYTMHGFIDEVAMMNTPASGIRIDEVTCPCD